MAKTKNCGCPTIVQISVPESSCLEIKGIPAASEAVVPGGSTAALTDKQKIQRALSELLCIKKRLAEQDARILVLETFNQYFFTPNSTGEQFFINGITDAAIPRVVIIP